MSREEIREFVLGRGHAPPASPSGATGIEGFQSLPAPVVPEGLIRERLAAQVSRPEDEG